MKVESIRDRLHITMIYIYVLKLANNKYYIGRTKNPQIRINDHCSGHGSVWTRKYPVEKILEIVQGDAFDEDKYTLRYMQEYGIDNVRGGSFSAPYMSADDYRSITKQLRNASDRCFLCGDCTHFVRECPHRYSAPEQNNNNNDDDSFELMEPNKKEMSSSGGSETWVETVCRWAHNFSI
jgi:uncharacterized protein YlaI